MAFELFVCRFTSVDASVVGTYVDSGSDLSLVCLSFYDAAACYLSSLCCCCERRCTSIPLPIELLNPIDCTIPPTYPGLLEQV